MSGRRYILPFLLGLVLAFAFPAFAGDGDDDLSIPTTAVVEKDTDVSAMMFSDLIGEPWRYMTGLAGTPEKMRENNILGGDRESVYSGLVVKILEVLNLCAMAFVATSIIYMWGIFGITTAHEGKKLGGSVFSSLWVPVRHAFSFSLTVPVLNGLSLMQVAIVACIGISINFANVIWDASGRYIGEHIRAGIIDSSSSMLENEAFRAIPYMFADVVLQEVEKAHSKNRYDIEYAEKKDSFLDYLWEMLAGGPKMEASGGDGDNGMIVHVENWTEVPEKVIAVVNGRGETDPAGEYLYITDVEAGKRHIQLLNPQNVSRDAMAGVTIGYVSARRDKDGNLVFPTTRQRELFRQLAEIRSKNLVILWEGLRQIATGYLGSHESMSGASTNADSSCAKPANGQCAPYETIAQDRNLPTIQKLTSDYIQNIKKESAPLIKKLVQDDERLAVKFRNALDTGDNGSRFGWMSAGLFTFTLASLQKDIDEQVMGNVGFTGRSALTQDKAANSRYLASYNKRLDEVEKSALRNAPAFASRTLLSSSRYAAEAYAQMHDERKNLADRGGDRIMKGLAEVLGSLVMFPAEGEETNTSIGLLGQALNAFGKYDPIVVMQTFGDSLFNAVWGAAIISAGFSFYLKSVIGIGLIFLILVTGCFFAYVVPITPVLYWGRAIISWFFMVIEALVAAPFWVCTHALPEGRGFAGDHARRGYMMLLDIVIRPALLVLGAVFAIAVIQALGWLFGVLFNSWFTTVSSSFISMGLLADISFTVILMSFMYYMSLTVFTQGVNHIPEHVLSWCGGSARTDSQSHSGMTMMVLGGGTKSFQALSHQAQAMMAGGGSYAGKLWGEYKQQQSKEQYAEERKKRHEELLSIAANHPDLPESVQKFLGIDKLSGKENVNAQGNAQGAPNSRSNPAQNPASPGGLNAGSGISPNNNPVSQPGGANPQKDPQNRQASQNQDSAASNPENSAESRAPLAPLYDLSTGQPFHPGQPPEKTADSSSIPGNQSGNVDKNTPENPGKTRTPGQNAETLSATRGQQAFDDNVASSSSMNPLDETHNARGDAGPAGKANTGIGSGRQPVAEKGDPLSGGNRQEPGKTDSQPDRTFADNVASNAKMTPLERTQADPSSQDSRIPGNPGAKTNAGKSVAVEQNQAVSAANPQTGHAFADNVASNANIAPADSAPDGKPAVNARPEPPSEKRTRTRQRPVPAEDLDVHIAEELKK